jgi:hypothetical protein
MQKTLIAVFGFLLSNTPAMAEEKQQSDNPCTTMPAEPPAERAEPYSYPHRCWCYLSSGPMCLVKESDDTCTIHTKCRDPRKDPPKGEHQEEERRCWRLNENARPRRL